MNWAKGKLNGGGKEYVTFYLEPQIKGLDQLGFRKSQDVAAKIQHLGVNLNVQILYGKTF